VVVLAFLVAGCSSSAASGSPESPANGASAGASESVSAQASIPAASGSSAPAPASPTAAAGSPAASTSGGGSGPSSTVPSPSASAASGGADASGAPSLAANLCEMLDQAAVERITGLHLSAGQQLAPPKGYTGACTWAEGQSAGFELSAQTEATIRSEIAHPPSGYKTVNGVGVAAKVKTATLFYTNIKEVSLIVNEGTYGLVFGLTSTTATVAQDVALAKAVQ
jgi:hypothetical protein